jgi:hypothetical protein
MRLKEGNPSTKCLVPAQRWEGSRFIAWQFYRIGSRRKPSGQAGGSPPRFGRVPVLLGLATISWSLRDNKPVLLLTAKSTPHHEDEDEDDGDGR